jgi:transglutaminase-like putative cysteine protease
VRYLIERESCTRFDAPVREHLVQLRVAPWEDEWQRLASCTVSVDPYVEVASHFDGFGNRVHRFGVMRAHERLATRLRAEVETRLVNPFDFEPVSPARERAWIDHSLRQAPRLWDFVLHRSAFTPSLPGAVGDRAVPAFAPGSGLLGQVQEAMAWIGELFELDRRCTDPRPVLADVLESRCANAADMAHLMVALTRGWGIPSRYVLGYVDPGYFEPDEDGREDGEPFPQIMHAWAEVLIPGAGWRGLDPSQGLLADQTYVRVAVGRDAGDVRTQRASCKGDTQEPDQTVTLDVRRLGDSAS